MSSPLSPGIKGLDIRHRVDGFLKAGAYRPARLSIELEIFGFVNQPVADAIWVHIRRRMMVREIEDSW